MPFRKNLLRDPNILAWMHIQCQENGSYRSCAMCELLQQTLPVVVNDDDSAIICLDWSVAHRTAEIASLVASSKHVLLFHGGGATGYEQVNDTHLHAMLQAVMQALEVAVFYGQLADNKAIGVQKAASHSRQELVNMIKAIWEQLNHAAISKRGYEQIGPFLPLEGPIMMKDIGADLLPFFRDLCPTMTQSKSAHRSEMKPRIQ